MIKYTYTPNPELTPQLYAKSGVWSITIIRPLSCLWSILNIRVLRNTSLRRTIMAGINKERQTETEKPKRKSATAGDPALEAETGKASRSNLALYLGTLALMILIAGGLAALGYFVLPFLLPGAILTAGVLGAGGLLLGLTLGMITAALTRNTEDFSFGAFLGSEIERDINAALAQNQNLDRESLYKKYDTDRSVFFSSQKMLSYAIISIGIGLGIAAGLLFNIALPAVFAFMGPIWALVLAGVLGAMVGVALIGVVFTAADLLGSRHAFEKIALAQPFTGIASVFGLRTLEEAQSLDVAQTELPGVKQDQLGSEELKAVESSHQATHEFSEANQVEAQTLLQTKVLSLGSGSNTARFIQGSKDFFRGFAELISRENTTSTENLIRACRSLAGSSAGENDFKTFFNQFEDVETALYKLGQPARTQIQATVDQYKVALLTQALLDPKKSKEYIKEITRHLEYASRSVLEGLQESLRDLESQNDSKENEAGNRSVKNPLLQAAQEQVDQCLSKRVGAAASR